MLRYLAFQTIKQTSGIRRTIPVFSNLLSSEIRSCHNKGIFYNEDDIDESSENFPKKTSHRAKPFQSRNPKNFYSDSRSNFGEASFQRNTGWRQRNYDEDGFKPRNRYDNGLRQRSYDDNDNSLQSSRFSKRDFDSEFGSNLKKVDFQNLSLIVKDFYAEHEITAKRTLNEVTALRGQWSMAVNGSNIPNPIVNFEELNLPDSLKQVVMEQGYDEPTPIQAQGWPTVFRGRDMVGISQTGSGKTLVYILPAIIHATNHRKMEDQRRDCSPQILVLAPTRELVQQIVGVSSRFSKSCKLRVGTAYGGASKSIQLQRLRGADICVATPGRLIDFVSEGSVNLSDCTYLVLDEADRMLDMGFEPQIRKIVNQIRPDRQTLMWSATWPKEIRALAEDFLTDYVQVTVGAGQLVANPNIQQNVYCMEEDEKEDGLSSLLDKLSSEGEAKVLVFVATKRKVDDLKRMLRRNGINALRIHGDVSQFQRDEVLKYFRSESSCILLATDVAARGLDITDVRHVVNYDMPTNIEDYIHRIGRTARGVASGTAHTFFTEENAGLVKDLVSVLKQANQPINEELYSMEMPRKTKSRRRSYNYGRNPRQRSFTYVT